MCHEASEVYRIDSRASVDAANDDVSTKMGTYKPSKIEAPSTCFREFVEVDR